MPGRCTCGRRHHTGDRSIRRGRHGRSKVPGILSGEEDTTLQLQIIEADSSPAAEPHEVGLDTLVSQQESVPDSLTPLSAPFHNCLLGQCDTVTLSLTNGLCFQQDASLRSAWPCFAPVR